MPDPPMIPRTDLAIWGPLDLPNKRGPKQGPTVKRRQAVLDRCFSRILSVSDLAWFLDLVPHLLLGKIHEPGEHDQENHHLKADALALHQMRLRGPHQEGRDVL